MATFFVQCPMISSSTSSSTSSSSPSYVPNFSGLVNKQAASYELIADSLGSLDPMIVAKIRAEEQHKARQGQGQQQQRKRNRSGQNEGSKRSRNNNNNNSDKDYYKEGDDDDHNHNHNNKKHGHNDDDDDVDDDDDWQDPYGLIKHSRRGGPPLPVLIKKTELAVVDLKVLVKHSDIPKDSKQMLVERLERYHLKAKVASRQMQVLQSRTEGCLDGLVIRNMYLIRELDRLQHQQELLRKERTFGLWDRLINLASGGTGTGLATSERKVVQLYQSSMEDARRNVRDLIFKTQLVVESLDILEDTLMSISELTVLEKKQQRSGHSEVMAQIWTRLGGNRLEVESFGDNLDLLENMDGQRMAAKGQISAALLKLTSFEIEMGNLNEKIADAVIVGASQQQPLVPSSSIPTEQQQQQQEEEGLGVEASSLREHIEHIEVVSRRLKYRSFIADETLRARANGGGDGDDDGSSSL
ncbi:hypothetical protein BGZ65_005742 [Modicella reniformis]|uniref:Uncharacterized protein n=1 Tax=Modicella reniformis TaxID=1440133 RepID=A0A9P6IX36_9FUNG|nr:hypothetical protein BGZ65_005742 [Modicella reniformis]